MGIGSGGYAGVKR